VILKIGSVPTPWPSWLIAAHPERASSQDVIAFLTGLTAYVQEFDSEESREKRNVPFIKDKFGYSEEDIKEWMKNVSYPMSCLEIPSRIILDTLSVLEKAGLVKQPIGGFNVDFFINREIVKLT